MAPLMRNRSILDSVHGLIRLTQEEIDIVDHPLFQRLRNIRQNGLLNLVFPSATHTRFEHSLGVLFVANSMLGALIHNSKVAAAKKPRAVKEPRKAKAGEALDFSDVEESTLDKITRITRLAALVHDLGHGPLSHAFDIFAPDPRTFVEILKDPRLAPVEELAGLVNQLTNKQGRMEHEAISCLFFSLIWGSREPWVPSAVTAAILGDKAADLTTTDLKPWIPLVHDLIASAPADADRMDYLERDSVSLGVTYGLFDRNRLLKTLLCYVENSDGVKRYRLGLKRSGMRAVENLLQARFELFVQVYYHKTNRAISMMLDAVGQDCRRNGIELWSDTSLDGLAQRYLELSDEYFIKLLSGRTPQTMPGTVSKLMQDVAARRLWKRVIDCEYVNSPEETKASAETEMEALKEEFNNAPLAVDSAGSQATKGLDEGARLLVRGADGVYALAPSGSWEDVSPIFAVLSKRDRAVVRVYLCADDEELASKIRFKHPDQS